MTTTSTPATRSEATSPAPRSSSQIRRDKRRWTGWGFVLPFLVVFALVLVAPVVYAIYLSLFQEQMIGGNSFVGADNYVRALTDPNFWDALGRVALFLVVQVPIMLFIALFAALALDSARLHFTAFFRISIFLPYAVPAVVAALMWGFIYGNRFGLVGNLEDATGWDLPDLLSQSWVLASIGNIVTWEFVGYNMLLFYAALRVISPDLYEAAELDGANWFQRFRWITISIIRPEVFVVTLTCTIAALKVFGPIYALTRGGPGDSTIVPSYYSYTEFFQKQQVGYGATIATALTIVIVILAVLFIRAQERVERSEGAR